MKLTSETERRLVDFFWVGCMKTYERNWIPAVDEKTQEQREFQKGSGTIPVDAASFLVRFLPEL